MGLRHGRRNIDLSKLSEKALWSYAAYHDLKTPPQSDGHPSRDDLLNICSKHFTEWEVEEANILSPFTNINGPRLPFGSGREIGDGLKQKKRPRAEFIPEEKQRRYIGGLGSPELMSPAARTILKAGERVAAKVLNSNENGSWILATVIRYFAHHDRYEVQDADDVTRKFVVSASVVRQLGESMEGVQKGEGVLAMFPETTSFYRAVVSKAPRKAAQNLVLQFEDDEDDNGKTPHRQIPCYHILSLPENHYEDEDEEEPEGAPAHGISPPAKRRRY
ncbi:unnamed protein product [Chrysoparadoxa australica]